MCIRDSRCTVKNEIAEWEYAYKWMRKQLKCRIKHQPQENHEPIWAWYQYESSFKKKPDLRRSSHLPRGSEGIRLEFVKESNQVLMSDFELWHAPLNSSYLGQDEFEQELFESRMEEYNLQNHLISELPEKYQVEIEKSWHRVFDLNHTNSYWGTSNKHERSIQACLWEINANEIIKIDHFIAR